jgi:HTH-type transcriptional regulator / antitoxin HigA
MIANESEYQRVLAIIESLMHQTISAEQERMLNLFLILVEKFEADNYPLPNTSTPTVIFSLQGCWVKFKLSTIL